MYIIKYFLNIREDVLPWACTWCKLEEQQTPGLILLLQKSKYYFDLF